jgi:hypothetical protein
MENKMPITYEKQYKDYPILTDRERKLGCDTKVLEKIEKLTTHTTQKHNKILGLRMDLNYPSNMKVPTDNTHIQKFMSKFIKYCKRQDYDPHYIWVREQSREKHQHYHLALLCNGNKLQNPGKLLKKAEDHWCQSIGEDATGLVDHCTKSRKGEPQPNSYMMRRNDDDFEQKTKDWFQRCSYLAKTNTKGYTPHRVREFGYSKVTSNR